MCLIIHKPVNVTIPEDILESGLRRNPDGWGIVYRSAGQVVALHGCYVSTRKSRKMLRRALRDQVGPRECLVHLRMATHGKVSLENTHPFRVRMAGSDDVWLMHNGVLSGYGKSGAEGESDTRDFLVRIIEPLTTEFGAAVLENPAIQALLADHIGDNRLAFMDAERGVLIVNRGQGVEHGGCWLSNTYAWDAPWSLMAPPASWRGHWPLDWDDQEERPGPVRAIVPSTLPDAAPPRGLVPYGADNTHDDDWDRWEFHRHGMQ